MCCAAVIDWLRNVFAVSVSYGYLLSARMICLTAIFDLYLFDDFIMILLLLVDRLYVVITSCLFVFVCTCLSFWCPSGWLL